MSCFSPKGILIMNAKLLFSGTLALALASTFALADEAKPLSRADVIADYQNASANGTLRKNDYDYDAHDLAPLSSRTRDEVIAELAAARAGNTLVGPLRNRSYNQFGTELLRTSTLARAQVKADVVTAMRDGTLRRSDYDDVPVTVARRVRQNRTGEAVIAGTTGTHSGN
jgi:hypothetical protein